MTRVVLRVSQGRCAPRVQISKDICHHHHHHHYQQQQQQQQQQLHQALGYEPYRLTLFGVQHAHLCIVSSNEVSAYQVGKCKHKARVVRGGGGK